VVIIQRVAKLPLQRRHISGALSNGFVDLTERAGVGKPEATRRERAVEVVGEEESQPVRLTHGLHLSVAIDMTLHRFSSPITQPPIFRPP